MFSYAEGFNSRTRECNAQVFYEILKRPKVEDLTGEQAESYTPLDPALMHRVQCELRARQWTDKDGQLSYSNEITIRRIV